MSRILRDVYFLSIVVEVFFWDCLILIVKLLKFCNIKEVEIRCDVWLVLLLD